MGGTTFAIRVGGETPKAAFLAAIKEEKHNYGHAGYTGSIAEKSSFVEIKEVSLDLSDHDKMQYAEKLIDDNDPRVDDKWGPAGMIRLREGYLFFGWASC